MEVNKLPEQTAAEIGFNYKVILTADDLTTAAAATAQTIQLVSAGIGAIVRSAAFYLKTAFSDASDTAFNATTMTVGDGGSVARFIASKELNVNGTEILAHVDTFASSTMPYAYLAADTIDAVFTPMTGKSLVNIDVGEIWIYLDVVELSKF